MPKQTTKTYVLTETRTYWFGTAWETDTRAVAGSTSKKKLVDYLLGLVKDGKMYPTGRGWDSYDEWSDELDGSDTEMRKYLNDELTVPGTDDFRDRYRYSITTIRSID